MRETLNLLRSSSPGHPLLYGPWPKLCPDEPWGHDGPSCVLVEWHDGPHESDIGDGRVFRWDRAS